MGWSGRRYNYIHLPSTGKGRKVDNRYTTTPKRNYMIKYERILTAYIPPAASSVFVTNPPVYKYIHKKNINMKNENMVYSM